jgi:regulator of replication initiation timing
MTEPDFTRARTLWARAEEQRNDENASYLDTIEALSYHVPDLLAEVDRLRATLGELPDLDTIRRIEKERGSWGMQLNEARRERDDLAARLSARVVISQTVSELEDELSRLRAELETVTADAGEQCREAARRTVEAQRERDEARAAQGVLGEIAAEQAQQDAKWGEQNHPDGTGPWVKNPDRVSNMEDQAAVARFDCQEAAKAGRLNWMLILREEVYEAYAEQDPAALRTELVQVAAVAATWVEAIDRRALGLDQDGEGQANG